MSVHSQLGTFDFVETRIERLSRVRQRMAELDIDALLLSLGADLPWLAGYEAMPLERPTVLVVPSEDDPTLVVPELEAPRVRHDERLFRLRPWQETESAVEIVAELVGKRVHLAISERSFSSLLIDLQRRLPGSTWTKASDVVGVLRARKDPAEIAALHAAGVAADAVTDALLSGEIPLIGRSEADVSRELSDRLLAAGHAKVNFAIVATGDNAASPHHEPSDRKIAVGETLVCDFGGSLRFGDDVGYCSDITRTVFTGEPDEFTRSYYEVLERAQAAAVHAVAPGVTCEEIDRVGRTIIDDAGFGDAFIHRIGHGIGIEEHEDPYLVEGNTAQLEEGNAFSIEPGIYFKGQSGARIEDIVVLHDGVPMRCNVADHSLHIVES